MFLSKKLFKTSLSLVLVASFYTQSSYGSNLDEKLTYPSLPPLSLHKPPNIDDVSSKDSESEEDRHLRIQREMREKLVERSPKTIILDISFPSNAEYGTEYVFNKDVTLCNSEIKTITFTFTKKKIEGNVRTFTCPFHCWCVSPKPSFKARDCFFDIHGNSIQEERKETVNAFSGLGEGRSPKEKSELDIASERMSKYMDILLEQTALPSLEFYMTVSGTSFQLRDRSQ